MCEIKMDELKVKVKVKVKVSRAADGLNRNLDSHGEVTHRRSNQS